MHRASKYMLVTLLSILAVSCYVTLPKRIYDDDKMILSQDETEKVSNGKVRDYVDDVMTHAKGYESPENKTIEQLSWLYIIISGAMFVAGFVCFGIAYISHQYKFNYVGFLSLVGAGTAAGFAELASFWWTMPVAGIVGIVVWFITHRNKEFSLIQTIKDIKEKKNDN